MISVLQSPLFTAVYPDGSSRRMGLLELLTEAHKIVGIKANSCTGKLALLRFCIAFLSEVYPLKNLDDREELLDKGGFDIERVKRYVAEYEAAGVSFLLDDESHPFMQAAYEPQLDSKSEKPVSKILFDVPGGNNHIHLDHRYEDDHEVNAQTAFEAMLETYLFCPAGLSGASNVNNTPPVYAILHGNNLFETLVLNMVSDKEIENISYGEGEAAWKRCEAIIPGTMTADMSYIKALTWQPRRLTLQWDEDRMVRKVYLQNGLDFRGNGLWMDPHVIYRKNKDGSFSSVKPDLDRELWRDAGNLLSGSAALRSTIPLQNLNCNIWMNMPDRVNIEIIGMATNNEAILGRVNELMRLPSQLLLKEDLAQDFQVALEKTESMLRSLDGAVKWQFCHPGDRKRVSVVAKQACEVFLHSMHSVLFGGYLDNLIGGIPFPDRRRYFLDEMWRVLDMNVLKEIVERTGSDVPSMKRQNAVRAKVLKDYRSLAGEE